MILGFNIHRHAQFSYNYIPLILTGKSKWSKKSIIKITLSLVYILKIVIHMINTNAKYNVHSNISAKFQIYIFDIFEYKCVYLQDLKIL